MSHRWKLVLAIKNGHRFFRSAAENRIAIADDSGHYPEACTDGILWLDQSRPIQAGDGFGIPMVSPGGQRYSTAASAEEAFKVAQMFGMRFVVEGEDYEVRRKNES